MIATRIGNRVVVIGRSIPAAGKVARRELAGQRATAHRIVVIKDGELVRGKPGR